MLTNRIGVDIVEIQRFRKLGTSARGKRLKSKLFTNEEETYCREFSDPAPHYAGIFAAKEAASKALGTLRYPFLILEVRHERGGAPYVCGRNGKRLPVAISISHDGAYAIAVAATTSSKKR